MSGGHHYYAYLKIIELSESIQEDLEASEDLSDEVKVAMRKFSQELDAIADKARALEWFMSSDSDEQPFLEKMGKLNPV